MIPDGSGVWAPMWPLPRFAAEAIRMRIPHDLRKVVVYIGVETAGRFVPTGTGFLVTEDYDKDASFTFVVTAKHVIDLVAGDTFSVRINRLNGPAESICMPKAGLLTHHDGKNDIALIPLPIGTDVYDYRSLPIAREYLRQQRQMYDPQLGDEVAVVGLYTSHHGITKNIPVTRIGNLAMLLDEPVQGPGGEYVDAYLIELRTIAGLSGSPVLLNPQRVFLEGAIRFRGGEMYQMLGILIGYHLIASREDQVPVTAYPPDQQTEEAELQVSGLDMNTGFGVVIPIERVMEILERTDVRQRMALGLKERAREHGFRMVGVLPDKDG